MINVKSSMDLTGLYQFLYQNGLCKCQLGEQLPTSMLPVSRSSMLKIITVLFQIDLSF